MSKRKAYKPELSTESVATLKMTKTDIAMESQ